MDDFLNSFVFYRYSAIFAHVISLFLIYKNKFSYRLNFTNTKIIFRHIIEGIFTSILLIILLLQINALSNSILNDDFNYYNLIFIPIFIPLFEELLYRYILMTLFLRKTNKILKLYLAV